MKVYMVTFDFFESRPAEEVVYYKVTGEMTITAKNQKEAIHFADLVLDKHYMITAKLKVKKM